MIRNYVKLALRHLRRHTSYAAINICGLAIGLTCCGLISVYLLNELSYDKFHDDYDRIYRVVEDRIENSGHVSRLATTFGPLTPALESNFPEIEKTVRAYPGSLLISDSENRRHQEDNILFVDSTFFEVFSFNLVAGAPEAVLHEPFEVVLTERMAVEYFGRSNPVGKILQVEDSSDRFDVVVSGIVQDPPENSHLQFDMLFTFSLAKKFMGDWIEDPANWQHPPMYSYVVLDDVSSADKIEAALPDFARKAMGEKEAGVRALSLQPLTDIRLRSSRENELRAVSDISYIYLFGLISLLILIIACANFINLATARASDRLKEMGVRRSMGAFRGQLIRQLLSESVVQVVASLALALVLMTAVMSYSGVEFVGDVKITSFITWQTTSILILGVLVVSLLAGLYPALYITATNPNDSLRGIGISGKRTNATIRKALVIGQFAISAGLILGTIVILNQLNYVRNERLGFDKENVVIIKLRDQSNQEDHSSLKEAIQRLTGVEYVAASSGMPGLNGGIYDFTVYPDNEPADSTELLTLAVDHSFIETYGMSIVAGRNFSEDTPSDASSAFIINESAAAKFGWENPTEHELTLGVWLNQRIAKKGNVVGVVQDFQYSSLHSSIQPMVLHIMSNTYYNDYLSVRLSEGDYRVTLGLLQETWRDFNPERPFEYSFLADDFNQLYTSEARLGKLSGFLGSIAVIIACLGLFGLAAFSAEKRTKEIGVRKVLGASVINIVTMLATELMKPIVLAFLIGSIVSYFALSPWLETFAYQVRPGIGAIALTGMITLGVGLIAIAARSIRAALADPVECLRYE